ncbi:putative E3 ubiquitin-protein ligase TRIP12-like protein, partial [Dinothrombium tinctorium]
MEGDISPFELIHSRIVNKLLRYLVCSEDREFERDKRIKLFLHLDLDLNSAPLDVFVNKLNAYISQPEQFPVRVHDVIGSGIRGTIALKFLNTRQLKCNLHRHRECNNLKQWRGDPVKIDPLGVVQAIERCLVIRGHGKIRKDEDGSDEENSDEDIDDNMTAVLISQGQSRHKLRFLIGDNVLRYNMTVYQAITQFSSSSSHSREGNETDTDFKSLMGRANIWVQKHTIYYRPYAESSSSENSTTNTSSSTNAPASTNASVYLSRNASSSHASNDSVKVPEEKITTAIPSSGTILRTVFNRTLLKELYPSAVQPPQQSPKTNEKQTKSKCIEGETLMKSGNKFKHYKCGPYVCSEFQIAANTYRVRSEQAEYSIEDENKGEETLRNGLSDAKIKEEAKDDKETSSASGVEPSDNNS